MTYRWAFIVDSVPFTKAVRDGQTSLGGSESTCLGTARALRRLGHDVHIFATQLSEDAEGLDADGCYWHACDSFYTISSLFHWDVVVGLRMPKLFNRPVRARYRILWNQDLMNVEAYKAIVMSVAWAYDALMYVSDYHQRQWEEWLPELKGLAWVTRNGFDPQCVPKDIVKDPNTIIHISRPERGLAPLLEMWPTFKREHPSAILKLCRYSSMYDQGKGSWSEVCAEYDADVQRVHADVGGIEWLGELNKADLYREIAKAAVMWYPGVPNFAETSCIAAVEAQACGTPFVGSWKGALPETVPGGYLVRGDAFTPEYQRESMGFVADLLEGCRTSAKRYRMVQQAGREHVARYTYDAIAKEWAEEMTRRFTARYTSNRLGVMRQLDHEDDLSAAALVANEVLSERYGANATDNDPVVSEAHALLETYRKVAVGESHTAENYADHSLDPILEMSMGGRLDSVVAQFEGCRHVLDVACGAGAYALALATKYPAMRITAIDFSQGNIDKATAAAQQLGLSDRIAFVCAPVWDFTTQQPTDWLIRKQAIVAEHGSSYDGLWVGEFIEHVAEYRAFIDAIESIVRPNAKVVYTCPSGPLAECLPRNIPQHRSHVHHFSHDDLLAVWGPKKDAHFEFLAAEPTPHGSIVGAWLIQYRAGTIPAGERPYTQRIYTTRPRMRLSVGILAHNAANDLGRCLDSVWAIADEILVADTSSLDETVEVAERYERKVRVLSLPPVQDHEEGFAGARNAVLREATGEWFLWIDTDELMAGGHHLRHYLETGGPYIGFALKQNHFQLDAPFHYDTPCRIFRTDKGIQFYGCVHEQPQMGDCNGDIQPALQLEDVQLAHFGYLVAGIRKRKAYQRNRPLLLRDLQVFPERRLGKVIWLRQLVQDADELTGAYGANHPKVRKMFLQAVALYRDEFFDPTDKYHQLGRPFYERALQALNEGIEVEVAVAGRKGGLENARAKPQRMWVLDKDELAVLLAHQNKTVLDQMTQKAVHVDPYVSEPVEAVPV